MPCSQTPAESRHQALAMPILLPSAVPNTSAPLVSVTGLYHTACTPPVYASQAGSLPHRATLGSGGWPVLSGSGLSPAGSQQEVSACLLHVNMLPPLPGFAWRNETMIKAGGSGKHGSWSAKENSPTRPPPRAFAAPLWRAQTVLVVWFYAVCRVTALSQGRKPRAVWHQAGVGMRLWGFELSC